MVLRRSQLLGAGLSAPLFPRYFPGVLDGAGCWRYASTSSIRRLHARFSPFILPPRAPQYTIGAALFLFFLELLAI